MWSVHDNSLSKNHLHRLTAWATQLCAQTGLLLPRSLGGAASLHVDAQPGHCPSSVGSGRLKLAGPPGIGGGASPTPACPGAQATALDCESLSFFFN